MKYFSLISLTLVLFFSCKKHHNDTPATPDNFSYAVAYDTIISVNQNAAANFSFHVKVLSGDISQNHLICKLTGLPNGITTDPDSMDVSSLLGGVFIINAGNVPIGSYPVQLSITDKVHGTETHNIVLKVKQPFDNATLLAGTYDSSYDFCQPADFYYYSSALSTVADTPTLLKITNIRNLGVGFVVRATVTNVITIPLQTIGSMSIWGSGTYAEDGRPGHTNQYIMFINDTIVSGVDTQTCTIHLQH